MPDDADPRARAIGALAAMPRLEDAKMAWNAVDATNDGDKAEAMALFKVCREAAAS